MSTPSATPGPTTSQSSLLPTDLGALDVRELALADLPPNNELAGDVPPAAFVRSVRAFGVMEPILVVERADGTFLVQDGRGRIQAARLAGHTTIPARVYPEGWVSPHVVTLLAQMRRRNPAADLLAIEQLVADGHDLQAICEATGLTPQVVRARLRLQNLLPILRAGFMDGTIKASAAEAAARLPHTAQQPLVERFTKTGKLLLKDVHTQLTARTTTAQAGLPDDLFEDADWRQAAITHAHSLLSHLPPSETYLRDQVLSVLNAMQEHPVGT